MRLVLIAASVFVLLVQIPGAMAASKQEIDTRVEMALEQFYAESEVGKRLARKAEGILVFPRITKAGFIAGGEYGEGALIIDGRTAGYYSTASGSIGLQIGAQTRTQIFLFLTEAALENFRATDGWTVGVDGSVALISVGAGEDIDLKNVDAPVVGFVLNNKGLMANVSLEGTKISEIARD